jgi:hypothetical protein
MILSLQLLEYILIGTESDTGICADVEVFTAAEIAILLKRILKLDLIHSDTSMEYRFFGQVYSLGIPPDRLV